MVYNIIFKNKYMYNKSSACEQNVPIIIIQNIQLKL